MKQLRKNVLKKEEIFDILSFQRTLVGLVRDLRGIAFAFNAKTSFMMLFDWMYPFSLIVLLLSCLSFFSLSFLFC